MGFFSFLETLFFISLAIAFVLIIMMVYHFKGRLVLLEQKTNTMFEIMSSMIKEMKDIRDSVTTISNTTASLERFQKDSLKVEPIENNVFSSSMPFGGAAGGLFPPELFRLFKMGGDSPFEKNEYDDGNDDEDDDDDELKKIVVSDTEVDSDDEDDVRIISIDIENSTLPVVTSLDDLEEQMIDLDEDKVDIQREIEVEIKDDLDIKEELEDGLEEEPTEGQEDETDDKDDGEDQDKEDQEEDNEIKNENTEPIDYRKLDVSYLRTMVLTRGLATDTKKLKKSDLVRLLES